MIEEADWDDLTPRLLAYTQYCLARHRMRVGPNRKTAHDYVTRGVYAVVSGRCGEFDGSLFSQICAVITVFVERDARRSRATA
jgi:hypothetical protein